MTAFRFPAGIYLLKVNNRNTRTRCGICSMLTTHTTKRRHWRRSSVFIVNFKHSTPCSVSIVNFEHIIAGWVSLFCIEMTINENLTIIRDVIREVWFKLFFNHFLCNNFKKFECSLPIKVYRRNFLLYPTWQKLIASLPHPIWWLFSYLIIFYIV